MSRTKKTLSYLLHFAMEKHRRDVIQERSLAEDSAPIINRTAGHKVPAARAHGIHTSADMFVSFLKSCNEFRNIHNNFACCMFSKKS